MKFVNQYLDIFFRQNRKSWGVSLCKTPSSSSRNSLADQSWPVPVRSCRWPRHGGAAYLRPWAGCNRRRAGGSTEPVNDGESNGVIPGGGNRATAVHLDRPPTAMRSCSRVRMAAPEAASACSVLARVGEGGNRQCCHATCWPHMGLGPTRRQG